MTKGWLPPLNITLERPISLPNAVTWTMSPQIIVIICVCFKYQCEPRVHSLHEVLRKAEKKNLKKKLKNEPTQF